MHYPLVRIGRGLLTATGVHLVTNGNTLAAIGASEVVSVIADVASMAPVVGNMMCVLMFWPTVAPMYGQYTDFHTRQKHIRELKYMTPVLLAVIFCSMY